MSHTDYETELALRSIEPGVLLKAIRKGAKPKVDAHLSDAHLNPDETRQHEKFSAIAAEVQKLRMETEKHLLEIRDQAHAKVDDHLNPALEHERIELAKSFKVRHKTEAKEMKAARRRLETIRDQAHAKTVTAGEVEQRAPKDPEQRREEKRELKAHQRKLRSVTSHAEPKVVARLSEQTENERAELASSRAMRAKQHAEQAKRSRQMLRSIRSNIEEASAAEVEYHAAVLLQAARRGSLAHAIAKSPTNAAPVLPSRARKAIDDAKRNRLSQRRTAVCEELGAGECRAAVNEELGDFPEAANNDDAPAHPESSIRLGERRAAVCEELGAFPEAATDDDAPAHPKSSIRLGERRAAVCSKSVFPVAEASIWPALAAAC